MSTPAERAILAMDDLEKTLGRCHLAAARAAANWQAGSDLGPVNRDFEGPLRRDREAAARALDELAGLVAGTSPEGPPALAADLFKAAECLARGQVEAAVGEWPGLRARIKAWACHAGPAAGPSLEDRAAALLTPNQAAIWRHLWREKAATYDSLLRVPGAWRDVPSDEAVEKALKRLKEKLEAANLPVGYITISPVKRLVTITD
jgi:hypothetical protein